MLTRRAFRHVHRPAAGPACPRQNSQSPAHARQGACCDVVELTLTLILILALTSTLTFALTSSPPSSPSHPPSHSPSSSPSHQPAFTPSLPSSHYRPPLHPRYCPHYRPQVYVASWVNAFYYDQDDLVEWMSENWESYQMHHMVALVTLGVGAKMK